MTSNGDHDKDQHGPSEETSGVPKIIWFLALHAAIGIAVGIAIAALLVLLNVAGINTMLHEAADPFVPMLLLFFGFAITFGSAAMGIAIMTLPYPKRPNDK